MPKSEKNIALMETAIDIAVNWWAEKMLVDEKREAFKECLRTEIREQIEQHTFCYLRNYADGGVLLSVVQRSVDPNAKASWAGADHIFRWVYRTNVRPAKIRFSYFSHPWMDLEITEEMTWPSVRDLISDKSGEAMIAEFKTADS